uniref:Uncharacterized protein n=1 Tax=Nelumbo nucifera TaxID=4432 RepID=A0A822ZRS3_NELNU|nr:TPA_asm: hypothetical protein HUJ06_004461 [Nelumbo nucifera]
MVEAKLRQGSGSYPTGAITLEAATAVSRSTEATVGVGTTAPSLKATDQWPNGEGTVVDHYQNEAKTCSLGQCGMVEEGEEDERKSKEQKQRPRSRS